MLLVHESDCSIDVAVDGAARSQVGGVVEANGIRLVGWNRHGAVVQRADVCVPELLVHRETAVVHDIAVPVKGIITGREEIYQGRWVPGAQQCQ